MSTGGPNTQRFSPFTPPLRGSFPLDREHKCDSIVSEYLTCIKSYNQTHKKTDSQSQMDSASSACKDLARKYFDCRMRAGLMTSEDLSNLGFEEAEVDAQFVGTERVMAELKEELTSNNKAE